MEDKYTDPAVAELVHDIHTDIARISNSIEDIRRALDYMVNYRPMPTQAPSPNPRNAATNPGPFRSGRWPVQDGTFPAGAAGITPAPGPAHADSSPGNIRPSLVSRD